MDGPLVIRYILRIQYSDYLIGVYYNHPIIILIAGIPYSLKKSENFRKLFFNRDKSVLSCTLASVRVFQFLMQKPYMLIMVKIDEIVKVVVEINSPIALLHKFVSQ